jgi:hypothetical protein
MTELSITTSEALQIRQMLVVVQPRHNCQLGFLQILLKRRLLSPLDQEDMKT